MIDDIIEVLLGILLFLLVTSPVWIILLLIDGK